MAVGRIRELASSRPLRAPALRTEMAKGIGPVTAKDFGRTIDQHYSSNWGASTAERRWAHGPVEDLPPEFRVLVFNRSETMAAYATRCMSLLADEHRLEIHLLTRRETDLDPALVELLTVTAHYHRTGSRLGLGHTVNFGRPWRAGSACTHGLLSLPYLDGPQLEWLAEPRVRFLWMVPITPAELLFKKKEGLEALEERFDAAQFDFLDPRRPSVV